MPHLWSPPILEFPGNIGGQKTAMQATPKVAQEGALGRKKTHLNLDSWAYSASTTDLR